jgi:hypothetical protein
MYIKILGYPKLMKIVAPTLNLSTASMAFFRDKNRRTGLDIITSMLTLFGGNQQKEVDSNRRAPKRGTRALESLLFLLHTLKRFCNIESQ